MAIFAAKSWRSLSGGPEPRPAGHVGDHLLGDRGGADMLRRHDQTPACILALALAGCASSKSGNGVADAATAPLSDLNLGARRDPARPGRGAQEAKRRRAAAAARRSPPRSASSRRCWAPTSTCRQAARPSLIERGGHAAGEARWARLRSTTESVIPFRGWAQAHRRGALLARGGRRDRRRLGAPLLPEGRGPGARLRLAPLRRPGRRAALPLAAQS